MDRIRFELWLDDNQHWTETPTNKRRVSMPAIKVACNVCEAEGRINVDGVELDCADCSGQGFILMPDREKAGEAIVECYYRQLEITDFNHRAEAEEEKYGSLYLDERK